MEKGISICITSCNRWDLLEQTIKSMVEFWDGEPPFAFYINEDSGLMLPTAIAEYVESVWPKCKYVEFYGHRNQIAAIDRMYQEVETPYIYHQECDWLTTKSGFIQKSLSILEEKPNILQVWLRDPKDRNGHPCIGVAQKTADGTKYHVLKTGFMGKWNGYSHNPGLRRLSDYKAVFPNGFAAEIPWNPKNPLESEALIGRKYFKNGYRACTLLEGYVRHIGQNRHVNP